MPTRETVSLHCTKGGSDKVYNMQLEQMPSGLWAVYAQNGRRGGTLTPRTKIENASYSAARAKYNEMLDEKLRVKGYVNVALSGRSLPLASPAPAAKPKVKLPPLPAWPELATAYAEVATYLGEPSSLKDNPQPHIVLLVDVAAGQQEGVVDAVAAVGDATSDQQVLKLLSAEGRKWYDQLSSDVAAATLTSMRGAIPW